MILDEPELRLADEIRAPDLAGWRLERYVEPEDEPFDAVPFDVGALWRVPGGKG